jgi:hypothetical protein
MARLEKKRVIFSLLPAIIHHGEIGQILVTTVAAVVTVPIMFELLR